MTRMYGPLRESVYNTSRRATIALILQDSTPAADTQESARGTGLAWKGLQSTAPHTRRHCMPVIDNDRRLTILASTAFA